MTIEDKISLLESRGLHVDGRAFAYTGDLLLTCKGTVGLMAVLEKDKVHIARQIMAIQPIIDIAIEYVKLTIETMVGDLKSGARSMIPGITRDNMKCPQYTK